MIIVKFDKYWVLNSVKGMVVHINIYSITIINVYYSTNVHIAVLSE